MVWKRYIDSNNIEFFVARLPNHHLSVQYNPDFENWHYSCWDTRSPNTFLIDTETFPKLGYESADKAKEQAEKWFNTRQ